MGKDQEGSRVLSLWLEIDLGAEPITGSIQAADEASRPFVGWLGLTSVLQAVHRRAAIGRQRSGPRRSIDRPLTRAERDIVELVCEGMTNPQIARRLGVSPRTVQGHLLKVFRKFEVSTRAELVARILRGTTDEERAPDGVGRGRSADKNAPSGAQESSSANETFIQPAAGETPNTRTQERSVT